MTSRSVAQARTLHNGQRGSNGVANCLEVAPTKSEIWLKTVAFGPLVPCLHEHDLRFGIRSAVRTPLFSLLAIITLALGIGANAAVFGVVKSVLLNALPFGDADRLVRVYSRMEDGSMERSSMQPANR